VGAKTKGDARDNFSHYFIESLSCISAQYVHPIQISPNRYSLTYEPSAVLLCEAGERTLDISQIFRVGQDPKHGGYKAITLQYDYTLNAQIDGTWKEIVSYHWHPDETAVREPHLHVGCECWARVHFPTRRISVERFIDMLFDYYGIQREKDEAECRRILGKNHAAFMKGSSWV
jgi:hypothetical protein